MKFSVLLNLFKKFHKMGEVLHTIEQGTLKGKIGKDYNGQKFYSFFGIPYAKPPVGELRFKAPQPPEKWSGIRDSTKEGSECYSRHLIFQNLIGSEDCLNLNVYTPQLPEDSGTLKPVMVWIHGGGFTSGSNRTETYGPEFLLTGDVVVISINYRLGVLGFLSLDDPKLGVPGNAACKDMVMALKWVQNNVRSFGGDPNNVTIFGESAGGAAVHLLVLSPMTKGLFHKAIAQSGCALNPWSIGKPSAKELSRALKCPSDDEEDILHFLQELPVEKLFEGQEKMVDRFTADFVRPVGPVIEKVSPYETAFLAEDPLDIILQGKYNKVPLMMGYTLTEGIFFDVLEKRHRKNLLIKDFETCVPHFLQLPKGSALSKDVANKIKTFYFGNSDSNSQENRDKFHNLQTDNFFLRGIYSSIKNHTNTSSEPLYLYRFSVDAGLNFFKIANEITVKGVCHADELGYLFKTFVTPGKLDPESIEGNTVRALVKFWTNFAKTGNPNNIGETTWKEVRKGEINFLDIGKDLTSNTNPERERMEFWDNIYQIKTQTAKL